MKTGLLLLSCTFVANGGVLASWNTNSTSNLPNPFGATTLGAGIDSASVSVPQNTNQLTLTNTTNRYGFRSFQEETLADAKAAGHYLSIGIQASSALGVLDLDSIDLNIFSPEPQDQPGRFFSSVAVYGSADGFATSSMLATATASAGAQFFSAPIDLDGSAVDGVSGSVEFRVFAYSDQTTLSDRRARLIVRNSGGDFGVVINGAEIPEMSSVLPLGCLLGFSIMGRRRRK